MSGTVNRSLTPRTLKFIATSQHKMQNWIVILFYKLSSNSRDVYFRRKLTPANDPGYIAVKGTCRRSSVTWRPLANWNQTWYHFLNELTNWREEGGRRSSQSEVRRRCHVRCPVRILVWRLLCATLEYEINVVFLINEAYRLLMIIL